MGISGHQLSIFWDISLEMKNNKNKIATGQG
jgi:hypothetical protein